MLTIHQLSIFIENKSGTLVRVLRLLKDEGIQIIASTIADTVETGIYRVICSNPLKAYETLKDARVAVSLAEVFAIQLDDEPGRAAEAISAFAEAGISISYLYSFLLAGKGVLIFRTDNTEAAADAIRKHGLTCIPESDLAGLLG